MTFMVSRGGSIRYKDNVSRRLALVPPNIDAAMNTGVAESLAAATAVMTKRVRSAVTRTGLLRASGVPVPAGWHVRPAWFEGRGPGRIESGRMINSIRWQMTSASGGVRATAGFINAPAYTAKQELGTSDSAGMRGIPPMLAYAMGHTSFTAKFGPTMNKYLNSAVRNAELGRTVKRTI